MAEESAKNLAPAAIAPDALARLLGLAPDVVARHLAEGAPANPDGTVNLIHYAAWLTRIIHR